MRWKWYIESPSGWALEGGDEIDDDEIRTMRDPVERTVPLRLIHVVVHELQAVGMGSQHNEIAGRAFASVTTTRVRSFLSAYRYLLESR